MAKIKSKLLDAALNAAAFGAVVYGVQQLDDEKDYLQSEFKVSAEQAGGVDDWKDRNAALAAAFAAFTVIMIRKREP